VAKLAALRKGKAELKNADRGVGQGGVLLPWRWRRTPMGSLIEELDA
jgi:hypothetical protein